MWIVFYIEIFEEIFLKSLYSKKNYVKSFGNSKASINRSKIKDKSSRKK